MRMWINTCFLFSCFCFTISEFIVTETFIFRTNKRLVWIDPNEIIHVPVESSIHCLSSCASLGETCCGGTYIPSSKVCKIETSGCCHAEWEDEQGTNIFHRKKYINDLNCKTSKLGVEYRGQINITNTGNICQAWSQNAPHDHDFMDVFSDEGNFCRNPDTDNGPWCYTTDSSILFEYCNVTFCVTNVCPRECKLRRDGCDYRGSTNTTITGRTCQFWAVKIPHDHENTNLFTEQNYCRNPDSEPIGPWCYTTDPDFRWELCDVPFCG